ncbi:DUF2442 domain-containing protein [Candidatus Methylospira mobilis]|uniref:DUF2442 domain-containing protein n=1 Tax=Candidatus Methylospira mobilis TaxID=1808979 RepID=A0A5Q0BKE1_9GAMM|nr:DUF2442 domain-containing protein [Candidatus Methylospira mobilis]QFY44303.1 DUF2442 domain-containing protein [Candidatus Methylospira mobilis]WNV06272.1 DUF2442 domain-containing protein [Candidatus Methylospira mobilis]
MISLLENGWRLSLLVENDRCNLSRPDPICDLGQELWGEMFEPLKDKALFATAYQHPVMKTVAWANEPDLAPEFLLELLHEQNQQAA